MVIIRPQKASQENDHQDLWLCGFYQHSPNSCLPTWGPSGESLYPVVVCPFFPTPTASFFSHVLANINNFESSISKCCCGSRKSMKSLVRHCFSWVPNFKMLLWSPSGSKLRSASSYASDCYIQNPPETSRISLKVRLPPFGRWLPVVRFCEIPQ